jgi:DNA-binding PadR family transcriptional regulator
VSAYDRHRYGYELGKLIGRGRAGERRRRFCRLTPTGQHVLARQRQTWDQFVEAVRLVTRGEHA